MKQQLPVQVESIIHTLREHLPMLRKRYSIRTLGVFGSTIRGEAHEGSDLDLLVEFDQPPSLIAFIAIEHHLSDLLGVQVDLVMKDALKPSIGRQILREVVSVAP